MFCLLIVTLRKSVFQMEYFVFFCPTLLRCENVSIWPECCSVSPLTTLSTELAHKSRGSLGDGGSREWIEVLTCCCRHYILQAKHSLMSDASIFRPKMKFFFSDAYIQKTLQMILNWFLRSLSPSLSVSLVYWHLTKAHLSHCTALCIKGNWLCTQILWLEL